MLNPKKTDDQTKIPIENHKEQESIQSVSENHSTDDQITNVVQQESEEETRDKNSNTSFQILLPINQQKSQNKLISKCSSLAVTSIGSNGKQRQQRDKNFDRERDGTKQETGVTNEQELQIRTDVKHSERSRKYVSSNVTHEKEPQNNSISEDDKDKRGRSGQQPEEILPFTNILSIQHTETENKDEAEKNPRETPLFKKNEYQVQESKHKHLQQPEEKSDPNINNFEEEEDERRIEPEKILSDNKVFEPYLTEIPKRPDQSNTITQDNEMSTTQTSIEGIHEQDSVARIYYRSARRISPIKENWELETIYSMYTVYNVQSSQRLENKPEENIPVSNQSGNSQPTNVRIEEEELITRNQTSETDLVEQDKINNEYIWPQQQKSSVPRSAPRSRRASTVTIRGQQQPSSKRQSVSTPSRRNSISSNTRVTQNTVTIRGQQQPSSRRQSVSTSSRRNSISSNTRVPQITVNKVTSHSKQRQSVAQHSVTKDLRLSLNLLEVASQEHEFTGGKHFERRRSHLPRSSILSTLRHSESLAKEHRPSNFGMPYAKKRESVSSISTAGKHSKRRESVSSVSTVGKHSQRRESVSSVSSVGKHSKGRESVPSVNYEVKILNKRESVPSVSTVATNSKKRESASSANYVAKNSKTILNDQISSKPNNNDTIQKRLNEIDSSHISGYEDINNKAPTTAVHPKKKVTIDSEEDHKNLEERKGVPLSREDQRSYSTSSYWRKSSTLLNVSRDTSRTHHHSFQHPGKSMDREDFKLVSRKLRQYMKDERRNTLREMMGLDQPHLLVNTRPNSKSNGSDVMKSNQTPSSATKNRDQKVKRPSSDNGKVKKLSFFKLFYKSRENNIPPNKNGRKEHGSFALFSRMNAQEKNTGEPNLPNTRDSKRYVKSGQGNMINEAQTPVLSGNNQSRTQSDVKAKKT